MSEVYQHNKSVLLSLEEGDMVEFPRGHYSHYGIYAGNGKVIHLSGGNDGIGDGLNSASVFSVSGQESDKAVIKEDDFFEVAKESRAKNGNKDHKYSPIANGRQIVKRARARLGEIGYNVIWKNCEHFAAWCRYGKSWSEQVDTVRNWAAVGTAAGGLALMAMVMSKQRENKN